MSLWLMPGCERGWSVRGAATYLGVGPRLVCRACCAAMHGRVRVEPRARAGLAEASMQREGVLERSERHVPHTPHDGKGLLSKDEKRQDHEPRSCGRGTRAHLGPSHSPVAPGGEDKCSLSFRLPAKSASSTLIKPCSLPFAGTGIEPPL